MEALRLRGMGTIVLPCFGVGSLVPRGIRGMSPPPANGDGECVEHVGDVKYPTPGNVEYFTLIEMGDVCVRAQKIGVYIRRERRRGGQ